jgi:hypothetical protein
MTTRFRLFHSAATLAHPLQPWDAKIGQRRPCAHEVLAIGNLSPLSDRAVRA